MPCFSCSCLRLGDLTAHAFNVDPSLVMLELQLAIEQPSEATNPALRRMRRRQLQYVLCIAPATSHRLNLDMQSPAAAAG